jgi:hypothetical protein
MSAVNPKTPNDAANTPVAVLNPYFKNCRRLMTFPEPYAASSPPKEGAGFKSYSLAN